MGVLANQRRRARQTAWEEPFSQRSPHGIFYLFRILETKEEKPQVLSCFREWHSIAEWSAFPSLLSEAKRLQVLIRLSRFREENHWKEQIQAKGEPPMPPSIGSPDEIW